VRAHHKFRKIRNFFAPKSADVRIRSTLLVRKMSVLDNLHDCGRLLCTTPYIMHMGYR